MSSTTDGPTESADHNDPVTAQRASAAREFFTSVRNWATVISFLMVQFLSQRSSRAGKLSLLLMIAEPLILILMFYLIRGLIRGMIVQYGESLLLFLVSGLFPFYMFIRTSTLMRSGQLKPGQRLPRINSLDQFLASAAANTIIWLLTIVTVFVGMWLYGIERARPASIVDCAMALFLLVMIGMGLGLVNTAIARFAPIWLTVSGLSTRGLLFFSGVIHIADLYTPGIRSWLAWNPILHGVDWFRVGVYGRYPDMLLDRSYLVKCAIVFIFIGLIADRASLRYGGK